MINKNDQNYERLTRYLAGESSEKEISVINKWLKADRSNMETFEALKLVWKNAEKPDQEWNTEDAWRKVSFKTGITRQAPIIEVNKRSDLRRSFFYTNFARVAAVLVILMGAFYLSNAIWWSTPEQLLVNVDRGYIGSFGLPDGSNVNLNAGSRLYYPEKFKGNKREVSLSGEAYFKIAHNSNKPFIINAGDTQIEVLGTEFNVQAIDDLNEVEVVVAKGKVSFKSLGEVEHPGVILVQNQMSTIKLGEIPSSPQNVNIKDKLAWLRNELIFDDASLKYVIAQLERKYDVDIIVTASPLLSRRISVSFKDEPIDQVLEIISRLLNTDFNRTGKNVIFSESIESQLKDGIHASDKGNI